MKTIKKSKWKILIDLVDKEIERNQSQKLQIRLKEIKEELEIESVIEFARLFAGNYKNGH